MILAVLNFFNELSFQLLGCLQKFNFFFFDFSKAQAKLIRSVQIVIGVFNIRGKFAD
jgi:hypothetical protein